MGQKVNPHGIRVGVIKDWDSRWFASKKDFSDNLLDEVIAGLPPRRISAITSSRITRSALS